MLAFLLMIVLGVAAQNVQKVDPGRQAFEARCARCHGADGNGGDIGPAIALRLAAYQDRQLASLIRNGLPERGMPPSGIAGPEMTRLLKFLRTMHGRAEAGSIVGRKLQLQTTEGKTLEGQVLGEGFDDIQLRTDDQRVHLLRRAGSRFREVTSETDWPTYNGDSGGNRYTGLTQINKGNVARLAMTWMFTVPDMGKLEVTPVVVGGMMYVTGPNECFALDAGSGRQIWRYKRPRTRAMSVSGGANRGVAVASDRVFMETDNAHVIALNRFTGELLWDTELADSRKNYAASSAPLPAGNLIISGVSGGSTVQTDSSQLTIRRQARRSGGSQPSRDQENQDQRRGKGRTSSMAALRPGSLAATIPSSTLSTGQPAIPARSTTVIIARGTISIQTAFWR